MSSTQSPAEQAFLADFLQLVSNYNNNLENGVYRKRDTEFRMLLLNAIGWYPSLTAQQCQDLCKVAEDLEHYGSARLVMLFYSCDQLLGSDKGIAKNMQTWCSFDNSVEKCSMTSESFEWLKLVAKLTNSNYTNVGSIVVQLLIAHCYYDGATCCEVDFASAAKIWQQVVDLQASSFGEQAPLVEQLQAVAKLYLGICYETGNGVEKSVDKAIEYFTQALAVTSFSRAQLQLAENYSTKEDLENQFKYYKLAADQGNANAMYNTGRCYENGTGVEADKAQSMVYYSMAADLNHKLGLYNAAWGYQNGAGVDENQFLAFKLYERAAGAPHNHAASQVELGRYYMTGIEYALEPFPEYAYRYFSMAANQGNAAGQYFTGILLESDIGGSSHGALGYFELAAAQGHEGAIAKVAEYKK